MIKAMFIADQSLGQQRQVSEIELVKGKGIVGDRNFDQARWPGQNITFIEQEQIDQFNQDYQQQIGLADTRRNIITTGIRLNDLVGKEFMIGETRLKGVELCEPCATLGRLLANDTILKKEVVRAFVHKSGLRADVISNGVIDDCMDISIL